MYDNDNMVEVTDSPEPESKSGRSGGYPDRQALKEAQMWACFNGRFTACERAVTALEPGQYNIGATDSGIVFTKHTVNTDKLFVLPDSASDEIITGIEQFWEKEDHFRRLNFLWKRGIMLYGPPGSGKTSCVQQISQRIVERGGIAFYVDAPNVGASGLELFRRIEPDRPVLVMLEDIDAIIANYGESSLLSLLDGELQIDNVVFIATTNYPERLDKRIINRPSRFDIVKLIGMPSEEARAVYLTNVSKQLADDSSKLKEWVKVTKGYSIAHLKELLVSVEVFEIPLATTVKRLNKMIDIHVSSENDEKRSHFGFGYDED